MLYENTYGNIIEAPVTQHSFDDTHLCHAAYTAY